MPTLRSVVVLICLAFISADNIRQLHAAETSQKKSLNVLFIGNSYTSRHNLSKVVKDMAEAGNPGLSFDVTTVIYGGRRLIDHWRLGTQNIVRLHALTLAEEQATIASLEETLVKTPGDGYAKSALGRHRKVLGELKAPRAKWDIIVLQSYRDDLQGEDSLYVKFAPRFAELAHAQGARVILYETTPKTQNAKPLDSAPDPTDVMAKARVIATLADRIDASVAPMSLVGLRCQTKRPDLTLRFINDAHLNQTMAYLTACTLYAAIFERSPAGLPVDSVTDTRYLSSDERDKDRDGKPITSKFSAKDRAELQQIAWEGYQEFAKLRAKSSSSQPSPTK